MALGKEKLATIRKEVSLHQAAQLAAVLFVAAPDPWLVLLGCIWQSLVLIDSLSRGH